MFFSFGRTLMPWFFISPLVKGSYGSCDTLIDLLQYPVCFCDSSKTYKPPVDILVPFHGTGNNCNNARNCSKLCHVCYVSAMGTFRNSLLHLCSNLPMATVLAC